MRRVVELIEYPLKSGQGSSVNESTVTRRGLAWDRRWMVVDPTGQFMTGRSHPSLIGLHVTPKGNGQISLRSQDGSQHNATPLANEAMRDVVVWNAHTRGYQFGDETTQWLSQQVGTPCELVFMPDEVERRVTSLNAKAEDLVSYADGFPILLTSTASLTDLNTRLTSSVDMRQFRPNIVVDGGTAFEEFKWRRIRIGGLEFESGGPCVRCVFTTREPMTGIRRSDGEPLKTLAEYQRNDDGVIFGINLIPRTTGAIRTGAPLEVI